MKRKYTYALLMMFFAVTLNLNANNDRVSRFTVEQSHIVSLEKATLRYILAYDNVVRCRTKSTGSLDKEKYEAILPRLNQEYREAYFAYIALLKEKGMYDPQTGFMDPYSVAVGILADDIVQMLAQKWTDMITDIKNTVERAELNFSSEMQKLKNDSPDDEWLSDCEDRTIKIFDIIKTNFQTKEDMIRKVATMNINDVLTELAKPLKTEDGEYVLVWDPSFFEAFPYKVNTKDLSKKLRVPRRNYKTYGSARKPTQDLMQPKGSSRQNTQNRPFGFPTGNIIFGGKKEHFGGWEDDDDFVFLDELDKTQLSTYEPIITSSVSNKKQEQAKEQSKDAVVILPNFLKSPKNYSLGIEEMNITFNNPYISSTDTTSSTLSDYEYIDTQYPGGGHKKMNYIFEQFPTREKIKNTIALTEEERKLFMYYVTLAGIQVPTPAERSGLEKRRAMSKKESMSYFQEKGQSKSMGSSYILQRDNPLLKKEAREKYGKVLSATMDEVLAASDDIFNATIAVNKISNKLKECVKDYSPLDAF